MNAPKTGKLLQTCKSLQKIAKVCKKFGKLFALAYCCSQSRRRSARNRMHIFMMYTVVLGDTNDTTTHDDTRVVKN